MNFQVHALPVEPFRPLFAMSDRELAAIQACRMIADARPGYPCRVSLADAEIGETVVLVNFEHQPADSPYRSRHAIFVREDAIQANPRPGEIPEVLRTRLMSLRAFDARHFMVFADVFDGVEIQYVIPEILGDSPVAYLHLHNAKPGCFAARVTRD